MNESGFGLGCMFTLRVMGIRWLLVFEGVICGVVCGMCVWLVGCGLIKIFLWYCGKLSWWCFSESVMCGVYSRGVLMQVVDIGPGLGSTSPCWRISAVLFQV